MILIQPRRRRTAP